MRILYVLSAVQEPRLGSVRHHHFIRHLAERHSITLLMLAHPRLSEEAKAHFASVSDKLLSFVAPPKREKGAGLGEVGRVARRAARRRRRRHVIQAMRKQFFQLAREERYDVVLFHGKGIFGVIDGFSGLPVVADFSGAATARLRMQLRRAPRSQRPWIFMRYLSAVRTERSLTAQAARLAFISRRDRDAVMKGNTRSTVVPNGIDLGYWNRRGPRATGGCIVFSGTMSYAPNSEAALYLIQKILPLVQERLPDVELLIVGRDPTDNLAEAGRLNARVTVTGAVEDIRPYLERATVFVAPIHFASGLQNKVLEAMAMEVPVVTTSLVAEGLRLRDSLSPPVTVAEKAGEFAAAVEKLLLSERARSRQATEARTFVEKHFDWQRGADQLEELCHEAAGIERQLGAEKVIEVAT